MRCCLNKAVKLNTFLFSIIFLQIHDDEDDTFYDNGYVSPDTDEDTSPDIGKASPSTIKVEKPGSLGKYFIYATCTTCKVKGLLVIKGNKQNETTHTTESTTEG